MRQPLIVIQRQPEFRKLWIGDLFSRFGTGITRLALPLTAAVTLQANAFEMGILTALGTLPNLLLGLFAGVIVDRLPRRPMIIATDIGRALLLATIPAAAIWDILQMEQLYAIAFLVASLDLFFDIASTSFLPTVLAREALVSGNAALSINNQISKIGGPSVAGVIISILTAPLAILLDAFSFLISAICTTIVRVSEPPLSNQAKKQGWWADIVEGLKLVFQDDILRTIVGASILGSLASAIQAPLLILFLTRDLELSSTMIGTILAMTGIAAFPGSFLAQSIADSVGQGRAIAVGTLLVSMGMILIPMANGSLTFIFVILIIAQLLIGAGVPIYAINQLTARQLAVPNHLQGRTNATRRFLMFGLTPLAAIASGYLGQVIGLRSVLLGGALLMWLALLWTIFSPLWSIHEISLVEDNSVATD